MTEARLAQAHGARRWSRSLRWPGRGGCRACPPGGSRDVAGALDGVLAGADAVVVFAGRREYRGPLVAQVKGLCRCARPAIVDGQNIVEPDARIAGGFACRGLVPGG